MMQITGDIMPGKLELNKFIEDWILDYNNLIQSNLNNERNMLVFQLRLVLLIKMRELLQNEI